MLSGWSAVSVCVFFGHLVPLLSWLLGQRETTVLIPNNILYNRWRTHSRQPRGSLANSTALDWNLLEQSVPLLPPPTHAFLTCGHIGLTSATNFMESGVECILLQAELITPLRSTSRPLTIPEYVPDRLNLLVKLLLIVRLKMVPCSSCKPFTVLLTTVRPTGWLLLFLTWQQHCGIQHLYFCYWLALPVYSFVESCTFISILAVLLYKCVSVSFYFWKYDSTSFCCFCDYVCNWKNERWKIWQVIVAFFDSYI